MQKLQENLRTAVVEYENIVTYRGICPGCLLRGTAKNSRTRRCLSAVACASNRFQTAKTYEDDSNAHRFLIAHPTWFSA